jgi:hypothetical protein
MSRQAIDTLLKKSYGFRKVLSICYFDRELHSFTFMHFYPLSCGFLMRTGKKVPAPGIYSTGAGFLLFCLPL